MTSPDLGSGFSVAPLSVGRFANAVQKNALAVHGLQVTRSDQTSSFVLTLQPDGAATVCRGWRLLLFSDAQGTHNEERIRERLGYSGRWQQRGEWVELTFELDDEVCPRVGQYSHLVPRHSSPWQLRGLPVAVSNPSYGGLSLLALAPPAELVTFGEADPHVVEGILSGTWLVLGSGNGLRIRSEHQVRDGGEKPRVHAEASAELITPSSWEQSF
jgi:hypothetical protein